MNRWIQKRGLPLESLGLSLTQEVPKKKVLYQLNENQLFIPASLAKVAVLSAFYYYYPSYFRFKTVLVSSASINKNQLEGDLFIKGSGDPGFTSESLWKLVNNFVRTGIKEIKGDLVIDDTLFKKTYFLPYTDRSYTAPVNAASFNWNSLTFWIRPNSKVNSLAQIHLDPENDFIKIINKIKTTSRSKNNISLKRIKYSSKGETFLFTGTISHKSKEIVKYTNTQNPSFWMGHNLKNFLKQRGIIVRGRVKKGSCSKCKTLATFKSRAFAFHSYNMMKYSSNFVTRMLTAYLPLRLGKKQGDLDQGIHWINKYLKKQIGLKNYKMVEPSGLSRDNRFSVNHFQKILEHDFSRFYHPEIFVSYPIAGGVGTLEKKYHPKFSQILRAKTGSISGVLGLSGYILLPKNRRILFTFIYNGSPKNRDQAKGLFDDILDFLRKKNNRFFKEFN
ncbi:MAG: D-alanyl-D-alanine carboxypeptidase/D-alanyl-D-alanine endopeptidase [Bdellovibrionales bacterium]